MRHTALVFLTIGLLSGSSVAFAQDWLRTPASSWSPKQLTAFLSDSPWSGRASVQRRNGSYPKHKATVTWESASLVRQARARLGQAFAQAAPFEPTYQVSVRIWGTALALELADQPLRLLERTMLVRAVNDPLRPVRVQHYFVKKDGTFVAPLSKRDRLDVDGRMAYDTCNNLLPRFTAGDSVFQSPYGSINSAEVDLGPSGGARSLQFRDDLPCETAAVFVFDFPATDPIGAGEVVEFTSSMGPQTVSRSFEMRQMVVSGALELR